MSNQETINQTEMFNPVSAGSIIQEYIDNTEHTVESVAKATNLDTTMLQAILDGKLQFDFAYASKLHQVLGIRVGLLMDLQSAHSQWQQRQRYNNRTFAYPVHPGKIIKESLQRNYMSAWVLMEKLKTHHNLVIPFDDMMAIIDEKIPLSDEYAKGISNALNIDYEKLIELQKRYSEDQV